MPARNESGGISTVQHFGYTIYAADEPIIPPACSKRGERPTVPSDFDYEDILHDDQLIWVTRRGRGENHRDYAALRQQNTRISLFVRRAAKEAFTYLGDVRYQEHQQFHDIPTGKLQQRYILRLVVPIPWLLYSRLHSQTSGRPPQAKGLTSQPGVQPTRKPSTFSETKRAFQYALGDLERFVNPAHYNYQTRLKTYLQHRGISAEFERDFVDVRWIQDGQQVIGEVKLTGYLTLDQAFRTALGQLLCYAHLQFDAPPLMVMFLDKQPDQKRLALARQLGVVVVAEPVPSSFIFCEGFEAPSIRQLFEA